MATLLLVVAASEASPQPIADPSATTYRAMGSPSSPAPATLQVVGLGDSVMVGSACGCPGIVATYADRLHTSMQLDITGRNFGVPGDTSLDLLSRLESDPRLSAAVAAADITIVTIGANDLLPEEQLQENSICPAACYGPAIQKMGSHLTAVFAKIRSLRPGQPATLLVTTYWNVFADGAVARAAGGQAQVEWNEEVTEAANRAICAVANHLRAGCVDLNQWFDDEATDPTNLLAQDGDHPNAAGVDVIAAALLSATQLPDQIRPSPERAAALTIDSAWDGVPSSRQLDPLNSRNWSASQRRGGRGRLIRMNSRAAG